jgi:hypothetical protein
MSTETVRIMCPNLVCRKVLAVPRTARGKTVKCRSCGISIRVPPENHAAKAQPQAQDGASKKSA